jgi:hypothetical protein
MPPLGIASRHIGAVEGGREERPRRKDHDAVSTEVVHDVR